MATKTFTIKVDEAIADEFSRIAQEVGLKDSEALLKNYVREVVLSARIEHAVAQLRDTVVRGSTDLKELEQPRTNPTK